MKAAEMMTRLRNKVVDGDFRAHLIKDPKAAISSNFGVTVPEEITIMVHEDSATTVHLVLPPPAQLTEEELMMVAGGLASRAAFISGWTSPPAFF